MSDETESEWSVDDLLRLAELIGSAVERGQLPPQNRFGQYLI